MKKLEFNTRVPDTDFDKALTSKKLDNLKDLQYLVNSQVVNKLLIDYKKASPDNQDLETLINAVTQIHFYVNELQNDRHLLMLSIKEYRLEKIRAIERARRVEAKLSTKKDRDLG